MTADDLSHGILGRWAVVGHGFNIGSISSSAVVIAAFALACTRRPYLYWRPSFRISAWVAVCDTIYSTCQLFVFNNSYMSALPEMRLRVIHWLMSASILSFSFLSACVGVQLVLTVLTSNARIARRVQPWYEPISLLLGFGITHPFLYLYTQVRWIPDAQAFNIVDEIRHYRISSWLTMWAWLFAACAFLMVVGISVFVKMSNVFPSSLRYNSLPEGDDDEDDTDPDPDDKTVAATYTPPINRERSRRILSVTIRILIYSLVPIVTQVWVLAANMVSRCPMWLYVLANLIPAAQGMINLLVFTANPAWDDYRHRLADGCARMRARRRTPAPAMGGADETASIEAGTLCSPTRAEK